MDCISHLGEPLDVFEGQLLHFARNQTPLCLNLSFIFIFATFAWKT